MIINDVDAYWICSDGFFSGFPCLPSKPEYVLFSGFDLLIFFQMRRGGKGRWEPDVRPVRTATPLEQHHAEMFDGLKAEEMHQRNLAATYNKEVVCRL